MSRPTKREPYKTRDVPIGTVKPYPRNPRHNEAAVAKVAASIRAFGFRQPIVTDAKHVVIAGHTRLLAAQSLGLKTVPVHVAKGLTPAQVRAYRLADNRTAQEATWDNDALVEELLALKADAFDLPLTGFDAAELDALLAPNGGLLDGVDPDEVPPVPAAPVTRPGDLITLGRHRLLCGDSRDFGTIERLVAGRKINVAFTSPPYASQRKYDESSGFKPIKPDEYVAWYRDVAANVAALLADDGSYFCNIKEHCEDGQRHLYVTDLLVAHVREWGWRWVDTFCWRDTANGMPGKFPNRFKDAWEPVYHYALAEAIRFRPMANSTETDAAFRHTPETHIGPSERGYEHRAERTMTKGRALPSNVVEVKSGGDGTHSAAFPVALPVWFVRAFSDAGDVVCDLFLGSGTTLIAAELTGRACYGVELSPAYCDVIVARWEHATGQTAVRP